MGAGMNVDGVYTKASALNVEREMWRNKDRWNFSIQVAFGNFCCKALMYKTVGNMNLDVMSLCIKVTKELIISQKKRKKINIRCY